MVVPHLNEPDDLRRCLAALAVQDLPSSDYEIIVVDNGSRHFPEDICSAFQNVRLVSEPVPGPGPARNCGAALARAGVICFIDADCCAAPSWLAEILAFFQRNPSVDIIAGDVQVARQNPKQPTALELYEGVFSYLIPLYVARDRYAATGNMSVRHAVFDGVGGFLGISVAEDREWGQRATAKGHRIAYLPAALVLTAPCKTFAELTRRWDRAIAHDYEDLPDTVASKVKWIIRSLVLLASPFPEMLKLINSPRISGWREFWLAWACLVRIRTYRAVHMLGRLVHDKTRRAVVNWNRE